MSILPLVLLLAGKPAPAAGSGDYDRDGRVTEADALAALKMSVGHLPESDVVDVDGKRGVTSRDAVVLLQWVTRAGTPEAERVAGTLVGLRWEIACQERESGRTFCACSDPAPISTRMGGAPGTVYEVTLRFRGVVERKPYEGGANDGAFWQEGGAPVSGRHNVYKLEIESPPGVFYLNRTTETAERVWAIDYTKRVRIASGARVTLSAESVDGLEILNGPPAAEAIVVEGVRPAPVSFDGQFIQMDVLSVAP